MSLDDGASAWAVGAVEKNIILAAAKAAKVATIVLPRPACSMLGPFWLGNLTGAHCLAFARNDRLDRHLGAGWEKHDWRGKEVKILLIRGRVRLMAVLIVPGMGLGKCSARFGCDIYCLDPIAVLLSRRASGRRLHLHSA